MADAMKLQGMRHIALRVSDMARAREFYEGILGLAVVWEPDAENVYLSSGEDNIALHAAAGPIQGGQRLDHFGFVLPTRGDVDRAEEELKRKGVRISKPAKDHRDGSRSFYTSDPDGNVIQFLYLPGVSREG
jgi:catechol 2,3-dioxygenase-like lactoylglutathione lyase family enzyme